MLPSPPTGSTSGLKKVVHISIFMQPPCAPKWVYKRKWFHCQNVRKNMSVVTKAQSEVKSSLTLCVTHSRKLVMTNRVVLIESSMSDVWNVTIKLLLFLPSNICRRGIFGSFLQLIYYQFLGKEWNVVYFLYLLCCINLSHLRNHRRKVAITLKCHSSIENWTSFTPPNSLK